MYAESAYLFRHVLLREAAYQLHLPSERARLHGLAFALLEDWAGGRAPLPPSLESGEPCQLHSTDLFAQELAEHLRLATGEPDHSSTGSMAEVRRLYLRRAAEHALRERRTEAQALWAEYALCCDDVERALALQRAGECALRVGEPAAERFLRDAVDALESCGRERERGVALARLGACLRSRGKVEEAEHALNHALKLVRARGTLREEGLVLEALGVHMTQSGRAALAGDYYQRALEIYRKVGDRRSEATVLGNIGIEHRHRGEDEQCEARYLEALAILTELGDRHNEATLLNNLAGLYWVTDRNEQAERTSKRALELQRAIGNRRGEGITLANMSDLLRDEGRLDDAKEMCLQALAIHREMGSRRFEGIAMDNLARLHQAAGEWEAARHAYEEALAVLREEATKLSEEWPDRILEPPVVLGVDKLGSSGVVLRLLVQTRPLSQWEVRRELNRRVKNRFDREEIEIPFPQQKVWLESQAAPKDPANQAAHE